MQGTLTRIFDCGSLVFETSTGLEVGYVGEGAAGRGVIVGGGGVSPTVVNGKHVLGYTGARKSKRGLNGQADRMAGSFPATKIATSVEKWLKEPHSHPNDKPALLSAKPRITIPKDILSALEWKAEDQLYIEVKGETLLVKKAPCV